MAGQRLTIGELARRTGVATSALRYWEQLGLLPAPGRVSGQRRYPLSAVEQVGVILLLRDVGFSLSDLAALIVSQPAAAGGESSPAAGGETPTAAADWRLVHERKLAELDQWIARAQAARTAIAHALACPHDSIFECPTFDSVVAARLAGSSIMDAHPH
jgi:DNA-binding transcriptional MerR regulator